MSAGTAPFRVRKSERSVQKGSAAAVGLLATVQVTLILAITVVAIGLPAIGEDLGMRPGQLALVSAGYGLAFSGLLLVGGRMADRWGPRRMLRAGLAGLAVASVTAAVSPSFVSLLLSRLGQGVGAALAAPAAMALLGAVFPDRPRHARALAWWGGLAPLGATAGIVLSGLSAGLASWRWAFAVPAMVGATATALAGRLLPTGAATARARLDLPGALLFTTGVVSLSYALVTAGDRGWATAPVATCLMAAVAALAGFAAVEAVRPAPLVPPAVLRSPGRVTGLAVVTMAAAAHASVGFFLALYLQQVRGLSPVATTAAFLPFLLPLPLAGPVAGRLLRRLPAPAVAAGGLTTAAVGLLLIGRLEVDTPYAGTLLAGLLVFPAGVGATFAAATVLAVEDTDRSQAGLAGGLVNTAIELGPAVGLALLVSLSGARTARLLDAGWPAAAAATGGYRFALTTAAAVLAAAAVVTAGAVAAARRRDRVPPSDPHTSTWGRDS